MIAQNLPRIKSIADQLAAVPFTPHAALRSGHAQTIISSLIRRRTRRLDRNQEARSFEVAPGVRLLAHCSWQQDRALRPTLLLTHGLQGSAQSGYMLGTAEKALAAGFNVIRLNNRNRGTDRLTPTFYHAGLTDDLRHVIHELSERDGLTDLYLVAFSLGGNVALKLAGEYADRAPAALRGVIAISPSIHLSSCADAIEARSNLLYSLNFVFSLRKSMRRMARLFPDRYDSSRLRGVWTIRKFDDAYIAPHWGFRDAADYYEKASSLPYIKHIHLPTLIIHAQDDPFIPFAPFEREEVTANPNVILLVPDNGGHVGFVSARPAGEDRFWAEAKAVQFVELLSVKRDT